MQEEKRDTFFLTKKYPKSQGPNKTDPRCSRPKAVILMAVCRDFFEIDHP